MTLESLPLVRLRKAGPASQAVQQLQQLLSRDGNVIFDTAEHDGHETTHWQPAKTKLETNSSLVWKTSLEKPQNLELY